MSTIQTKVFRFNPETDPAPYYVDYEVPWHDCISVLEVLRWILENDEPAAFDYSCRGASCGMCAMKVNGTPCLACVTLVKEGEDLVIEPLDGFPVIRDLVVDKSGVQARIMSTSPQFMRATPMVNPVVMSPDSVKRTGMLQQCRECMICQSVCPVIKEKGFAAYAGPVVMTKLAARYFDEREGKSDARLAMAVREGLFECIQCGTCTSVCPKGELIRVEGAEDSFIDHARYFKIMADAADAAGLRPVEEEVVRPVTQYFMTFNKE